MPKTILVVLIGNKERGETNHYQLLQEQTALEEGRRAGYSVEVVFAPGFDHLRVVRKRLSEPASAPLDAVLVEPASVSSTELILKELQGRVGLVLMNAWTETIGDFAARWGSQHPFGTVSTDHAGIGKVQGQQVRALLPKGGTVLLVTGPLKSSAAQQRLDGAKSVLGAAVTAYETEAGQWTEADGILAFNGWYGLYKARNPEVHVIAAHNDELAVGARSACKAVPNVAHRDMLLKARFLGVDCCPTFGKKLVDDGTLAGSIITPANTGEAIRHLERFWRDGTPVPLQAMTVSKPYPAGSAGL
jgi:ABC-type sugar transport system substrate-binding protein